MAGLFDFSGGGGGLFGGAIGDAAANNGIDADYLNRIMQIESGGNPRAQTGSYGGLFQLSPSEFRANGGGDIYNPADNANAAARMMAAQRDAFTQRYGREPSPTEMYLTHQQGAGGLAAHMDNPDRPAWESMLSTGEGRQKGEKWAKAAIWGNIPDQLKPQFGNVNNVTSQQFMDLWRNKVEGGMPSQALGFAGGSPPGLPSQASELPGGAGTSIPAMAQATAGQMPPSGLPAGNAAPPSGLPQAPAMNPLLAGFLGFANSRSPIAALGNLVGGIATGHRTDELGYEREQTQQAQLATYQAIKDAGGTEQQAVLGALNPKLYELGQKESEFARNFGLAQQKEAREARKPTIVPHLGTAIDPQTGQVIFGGATSDNAKEIAEAIRTGKQPPVTTGLYGEGPSVKAELARSGFDLAKADLQYKAAVKQVQSLNGPQAIRYQTLATTVVNTIDEVNALAKQMENIGVPLVNRAKLELYKQTQGNSPNGQLAARYLAATNTLKEEFANLANGGYAPTEPAWKLASEQINADFGVKQLGASLEEVQRLIRYRLNAIPNNATLGPAATNNPYIGGAPAAPVAPVPAAPSGGGWSVQRIQ